MRLCNASYAYFGLFLAREMARLGHLETFYTNLPRRRISNVPRAKQRSQPLLGGAIAASNFCLPRLADALKRPMVSWFDRWVARELDPCDMFHCFSSFGLNAHRAARQRFGALTVVERGSSHIGYQDDILRQEYARWGVPFPGIDPWFKERELTEYEECDRITVQSTFAETTFLERGFPREKLIKLPLGVDIHMFHPVPKQDNIFRVLYAGGVNLRKGIPYLLEAVAPLRLKDFEVAINGIPKDEVRPMFARHPSPLRQLGFQPLERLHEVYSQASVLVLPTVEDGFAKVVTEAMACGVPVIATTNCGAPDVLDDGVEGFIVPIRNPAAIREKILLLYESPERQRAMSEAALKRATQFNDWHAYGTIAAGTYKSELRRHRDTRTSL